MAVGAHARRQRHVLVVGAIGRRAAHEKRLARHAVLGPVGGVVVVDLVIVPGDDPGAGGVRGAQVGVGLVARVAHAVLGKRIGLARVVRAHMVAAPGRLVDVIAEEGDQVRRVGDDVAVGAVVALLVLLAGGEREAQRRRRRVGRGRGARAADRARRVARHEAVPVPAIGLEAFDVDVHRMRPGRRGLGRARRDDAAHGFVRSDFPAHRDQRRSQSAVVLLEIADQPRPQRHAARPGIAARHAEREGVAREARRRGPHRAQTERQRGGQRQENFASRRHARVNGRRSETVHGGRRARARRRG